MRKFTDLPVKSVAVHLRDGQPRPEGDFAPVPWPPRVVSTGVALLDWRVLREALRRQPQLKPSREGRVQALRG